MSKQPKTSRYIPISDESCEETVVRALVMMGYSLKYKDSDAFTGGIGTGVNLYSVEGAIPRWCGEYRSFERILDLILVGGILDSTANSPTSKKYPNKESLIVELDARGINLDDYSWRKPRHDSVCYILEKEREEK